MPLSYLSILSFVCSAVGHFILQPLVTLFSLSFVTNCEAIISLILLRFFLIVHHHIVQ